MSLLQIISNFFNAFFNRNSPEMQKKIQLKKLESELRAYEPYIFKNGNLLPNFAESIRILYLNTKPLDDLFSTTITGSDISRNKRFESQLVLTGYSSEHQQMIESLSYEARKEELLESAAPNSQIYDRQHKRLEKIVHELNSDTFKKIDNDLQNLYHLADFCRFSFVTILQIFDSNFIALDHRYKPSYQEIPIEKLGSPIEDLYFQLAGLKITTATANAIKALASLRYGEAKSDEYFSSYLDNLKKISYITKRIIPSERLKILIHYYKEDMNYVPKVAEYKDSARKNFSDMIQAQFKADEQRIKTELKDEKISAELQILFPETSLLPLFGYNTETNKKIREASTSAFMWIMPLQILKTFISVYFTDSVRSLLNDIVVEGFFNNPTYKTDFSTIVFTALEIPNVIQEFEDSFTRGKRNDLATLQNYIHNSHKDSDFYKKMELMISTINAEANKIITKETNNLNALSKQISSILQDAKKPASELISNLKVLMISPRNRDNTDLLERQYPNWNNFFEIMKNYAIISTRELG